MKKPKKHYGIEMDLICYKAPKLVKGAIRHKSVTEAELNKFMDAFLDLTESKDMCCGGGVKLIDLNSEGEMPVKKSAEIKIAMKQCSKAMDKNDPKLCPLWPKDPDLWCHDCTARSAWKWVLGEKVS